MTGLPVTEHEIHTAEPESLNVGKLNSAVRALREALYQERLRTLRAEHQVESARVALFEAGQERDRARERASEEALRADRAERRLALAEREQEKRA